MDFAQMGSKRAEILAAWSEKFDAKSEPSLNRTCFDLNTEITSVKVDFLFSLLFQSLLQ